MSASGPHAVDWDLFWLEHPDLEDPPGISIRQAREASVFLAGRARDAAELRGWLEMLGLIAAKREARVPRGCVTTNVPYERPGHEHF